jgi:hypothetical protein
VAAAPAINRSFGATRVVIRLFTLRFLPAAPPVGPHFPLDTHNCANGFRSETDCFGFKIHTAVLLR